jgi:hypothetical protein
MDKSEAEHVEAAERGKVPESSTVIREPGLLSLEHHDYLLNRHGTLDLNPLPLISDADPYNCPAWKVCWI